MKIRKMYKLFRLLFLFITVLFTSCEKNTVEVETHPEEQGPYQSLADFYSAKDVEAQVSTIDPTQPFTVTGTGGLQIQIPGNSLFNDAGLQPTGLVTVTLKEIYGIKDMV